MKLGIRFWIVETIRFAAAVACFCAWAAFFVLASMVTVTVG